MQFRISASDSPSLNDDVLISIKPDPAYWIFSGTKIYELRKVVPKRVPRRLFMYESNSSGKIIGYITISHMICGPVDYVWNSLRDSGISKERFFAYFKGCKTAVAFRISAALRFKNPIASSEIRAIEPGFRVPQNFLYLRNFPNLQKELNRKAMATALEAAEGSVFLHEFSEQSYDEFCSLVQKHITGSYLETGEQYARKILEIHRAREDLEGIFTYSKTIYEIWKGNGLAGFTVLTEKLGGSLKTGPTLLKEEFRDEGLGVEFRQCLHDGAKKAGFRKVYCTAPLANRGAINYLARAGYRVEAHLRKQYHYAHDEFVYGYLIRKGHDNPLDFQRQILPLNKIYALRSSEADVSALMQEQFSEVYTSVSPNWIGQQIRESTAIAKGRGSKFKPRKIYVGRADGLACAMSFCTFKRGGSVKILILSRTGHQKSICNLILYSEKGVLSKNFNEIRRFYSVVPLMDVDIVAAFYQAGYSVEGILERPYGDAADMIVFGKLPAESDG